MTTPLDWWLEPEPHDSLFPNPSYTKPPTHRTRDNTTTLQIAPRTIGKERQVSQALALLSLDPTGFTEPGSDLRRFVAPS